MSTSSLARESAGVYRGPTPGLHYPCPSLCHTNLCFDSINRRSSLRRSSVRLLDWDDDERSGSGSGDALRTTPEPRAVRNVKRHSTATPCLEDDDDDDIHVEGSGDGQAEHFVFPTVSTTSNSHRDQRTPPVDAQPEAMAVTQDSALHRSLSSASPRADVDRDTTETDADKEQGDAEQGHAEQGHAEQDDAEQGDAEQADAVEKTPVKAKPRSSKAAALDKDALFEVAAILGHAWRDANQVSC